MNEFEYSDETSAITTKPWLRRPVRKQISVGSLAKQKQLRRYVTKVSIPLEWDLPHTSTAVAGQATETKTMDTSTLKVTPITKLRDVNREKAIQTLFDTVPLQWPIPTLPKELLSSKFAMNKTMNKTTQPVIDDIASRWAISPAFAIASFILREDLLQSAVSLVFIDESSKNDKAYHICSGLVIGPRKVVTCCHGLPSAQWCRVWFYGPKLCPQTFEGKCIVKYYGLADIAVIQFPESETFTAKPVPTSFDDGGRVSKSTTKGGNLSSAPHQPPSSRYFCLHNGFLTGDLSPFHLRLAVSKTSCDRPTAHQLNFDTQLLGRGSSGAPVFEIRPDGSCWIVGIVRGIAKDQ